jgi:RimJ/RimL family protein N-acetyltransferase
VSFEPIVTDRLRIRAFVPEDWRAVHAYAADPATMTYVPPGALTEELTRAFVTENAGEEPRALALTLKADDRPIGHLVFHPWFADRTHEIGWVLHERFRGKGYTTEGARALLRYAFETLGLHRVIATCQPENVASWRVMENLGMRREGHFRQCIHRDDGSWWDEYFYATLAEEWIGSPSPVSGSPSPRA